MHQDGGLQRALQELQQRRGALRRARQRVQHGPDLPQPLSQQGSSLPFIIPTLNLNPKRPPKTL